MTAYQKTFRENGAIGALLDEYQKALIELQNLISEISDGQLCRIVDMETQDEDCRSIQTILTHVIRAGYNYVIAIRRWKGEDLPYSTSKTYHTAQEYCRALEQMFVYNTQLFDDYPDIPLESYKDADKIHVSWGQSYDVEQLFEHAIVHILRHRRQIERFLIRKDV